ncbi:DUF2452 domain-containing protein [Ulvibacter antarcticus]|uniref:Uncharacterized protein DUF2452 n=1 Tax=Ulvibacter antarcticus TaxID=442714 RepID=A0A3L9YIC5_9FLAO|nr:DUF2452 domain-containing protein [Ulvibacter antarcticus]RMA58969.1 uncharacterized protein DUF2452 [Ulvibacter antarcticus]
MSTNKIPDNVVINSEEGTYTASLKPYGTNVGAPSITAIDTISWKHRNIHKVNKQFKTKFLELKAVHDQLMASYEYNNLVYKAKFNFEPIVGEKYHLYRDKNSNMFLSVIAPEECNFDFVGSFYLNADLMWQKN